MVYSLLIFLAFCVPISIASSADPVLPPFSHFIENAPEWSEFARLAERSLLLDITRRDETLIAVGERGHVLVSNNGGAQWTQVSVPSRALLTAVIMADQEHCWIVGHDAVILHSSDRGKTWTRQFYAQDFRAPLLDVWFENANHGLAVGAYNLVLETHDGGKTWKRRSLGKGDAHLYAITVGPEGILYIAGEFGVVFRSIDYGKTWIRLRNPYEGSFFGILAPANGSLLAFGLRGNLYVSDDGGFAWNKVDTGTTSSLMSGVQLTDGTIVLVGLGGTILVSQDGLNFNRARVSHKQGFSSVAEVEPLTLVTVGEGGFTPIQNLSTYPTKTNGD